MTVANWLTICAIVVAAIGNALIVWVANKQTRARQQEQSENLQRSITERILVIETEMKSFMERISTFERHIQRQIDELKDRLGDFEKEMRREKSIR